jgi:4'-phosphopantetheinyl transferase
VHVWRASLDAYTGPVVLSPDEQARAARFKFPLHQQRFTAARSILRGILGRYLNLAPEALVFHYSPYGKPCVEERDIYFNLSHSDNWAAYAIAAIPEIGIDIEQIKPDTEVENIAQRFFSAAESQALAQCSADKKTALFYQQWTCKEAFIKASGEGLSYPLGEFEVEITGKSARIARIGKDKRAGEEWSVIPFSIADNYAAALAARAQITAVWYLHVC